MTNPFVNATALVVMGLVGASIAAATYEPMHIHTHHELLQSHGDLRASMARLEGSMDEQARAIKGLEVAITKLAEGMK